MSKNDGGGRRVDSGSWRVARDDRWEGSARDEKGKPASNLTDRNGTDSTSAQPHLDEKVDKKMAKRERYARKDATLLDFEDFDHEIRRFLLSATEPYRAALDVMDDARAQKLDSARLDAVLDVIESFFRQRIHRAGDCSQIGDCARLEALYCYIANRALNFVPFDRAFGISSIADKQAVGNFLLEQIKQSIQCNQVERLLDLFVACGAEDQSIILVALLIIFFKFEGCARVIENFRRTCDPPTFHRFIAELDRMMLDRNEILLFITTHDVSFTKLKNARDIKKFLNRMYKVAQRPEWVSMQQHEYYALTPHFNEKCNWDTLLYFLRLRFKQPTKNAMSNEAWLELSQMLVCASPSIKLRLLNTLRNIDTFEMEQWLDRFDRREELEQKVKPPLRNTLIHSSMQNHKYYNGRAKSKLTIKFVETETEFESMLDHVQHYNLIGLDGEWLPIHSYQPMRISILQISTSTVCFILDLLEFAQKSARFKHCWNRLLSEVFENESITKIGFGIQQDLENLKNATQSSRILLNNCVDLSRCTGKMIAYFAAAKIVPAPGNAPILGIKRIWSQIVARCREPQHAQQGLSLMTYILFGQEMDKSEQISNWNRRPLRPAQFRYCALDAFVLVHIYELLRSIAAEVLKLDSIDELLLEIRLMPDPVVTSRTPEHASANEHTNGDDFRVPCSSSSNINNNNTSIINNNNEDNTHHNTSNNNNNIESGRQTGRAKNRRNNRRNKKKKSQASQQQQQQEPKVFILYDEEDGNPFE